MTDIRRRTAASVLALTLAIAAAPTAQATEARPLAIPAGPLDAALFALARQTGQQLLFAPEAVRGRTAPALAGAYTPEAALARLLADSGLTATRTGPKTLVIRRRGAPRPGGEAGEAARPFVAEAVAPAEAERVAAALAHTVDELRVTGSHIRGARAAAPLLVLDRADLEATGHATLAAALNALPQVFSGQATEGTQATRADAGGSNTTFATSINLRGLGPGATLVLIDGRRVSGSGGKGEFVDVSTIPTVAVERVEVLLDGASAIYGSDAVGGVVNIVLRRDFEGGEARLRGGIATRGEPAEGQLGLAFGHRWAGGGLFLAYETWRRTALVAEDRAFTASADLTPFGGSDRRETFAFPGNIAGTDPVTGALVPLYAIPAGQPGTGLTPASFQAGTLNRQSPQQGMDILPDQRQHSAFLAVRQEATSWLELSGDLRYGWRRARAVLGPSIATLTLAAGNPFYVSPTGGTPTQRIFYSFAGELPNTVSFRWAESLSGTLAADARLPAGWSAHGYLGYSREVDTSDAFGTVNSAILAEALGGPDRPETAYQASRDGFFNPYTGRAANAAPVLAAINSGFSTSRSEARVLTANLQADGILLELPGGPMRLAVGAQARREDFATSGLSYLSTVTPVPTAAVEGDRTVAAAFAELRAPLLARDGAPALELSLAARAEDYSDFGSTVNPKAGLLWSPLDGLRLRATWGESFRAPSLRDLRAPAFNSAFTLPGPTGSVLTMTRQGGNPGLQPETATTWTLGGDWRLRSNLQLGVTWFRTRFEDRIDRPAGANLAIALTDPRFAPFVQRLDPRNNPADLALIQAILADPITRATSFPPESFGAIVDLRFVNTGVLEVSGLDLTGSYRLAPLSGELTLSANATRLFEHEQQLTPTAPSFEFVGQPARPARLRARLAADWRREAWSLGLAANHTSGFRNPAGADIAAQTTFDLQAGWAPAGPDGQGLALRLTVRNLLDEDPPFHDNPLGFAYDPTSGDPIGRFVALQLTRSW